MFSSLSQSEICQIITTNFAPWSGIPEQSIEITKLTGLTNKTYSVKLIDQEINPNTVIFREFGQTEGFIDKDLEKIIFSEIAKVGLGPKEYASGVNWRIEEFVQNALHPSPTLQSEELFQFEMMGVSSNFHNLEIPIQNRNPLIEKVFTEQLRKTVLAKMVCDDLYNENDLSILQEIKNIIDDPQQQEQLQSFITLEEEPTFCHNDLNHLNIFSTPKEGREIVFIDYDYCAYNFPSYDIANFLNESMIDYQHPEAPYYKYVQDNETSSCALHFIVLCYILHSIVNEMSYLDIRTKSQIIQQLKQLIIQNSGARNDKKLLQQLQREAIKLLSERANNNLSERIKNRVKFMKKRVRQCMPLSNYNWILWCVMQAKKPDSDFDYLEYATLRLKIYHDQMRKINEKAWKNKKLDSPHYSDSESSIGSNLKTAGSNSDSEDLQFS